MHEFIWWNNRQRLSLITEMYFEIGRRKSILLFKNYSLSHHVFIFGFGPFMITVSGKSTGRPFSSTLSRFFSLPPSSSIFSDSLWEDFRSGECSAGLGCGFGYVGCLSTSLMTRSLPVCEGLTQAPILYYYYAEARINCGLYNKYLILIRLPLWLIFYNRFASLIII